MTNTEYNWVTLYTVSSNFEGVPTKLETNLKRNATEGNGIKQKRKQILCSVLYSTSSSTM